MSLTTLGVVMLVVGILLTFDLQCIAAIRELRLLVETALRFLTGTTAPRPARTTFGVELILFGLTITALGATLIIRRIAHAMNPRMNANLADQFLRQHALAQGPRIAVVGGGTGLSTLLRGIKYYTSNITAVVTVTDEGGSSGNLQQTLGILPPGDIRNCLVALADAEPALSALFQYRFDQMPALRGHAFGNIFIAAMMGITGDFESAIRKTSEVLAIRGRVLPSTLSSVRLHAEMEDGSHVEGETAIVESPLRVRRMYLKPDDVEPLDEALAAIRQADIIVMGPGSVYTSVIPNLLVNAIREAIHHTKAIKLYVCNVMTQPGETDHYSASDHVKAIEAHVGKRVFDYVLVNTGQPSETLVDRYQQYGQLMVEPDADRIRSMGYRPILGNFMSESDVVRHDPQRLAEAIMKLVK
jgi:uncharacterized cofD-like protein